MLLAIFAALDFAAGISLLFPNPLGLFIGIVALLKGASSLIGGFTGEMGILVLGIIDILAGISLIFDFSLPFLWIVVMAKAAYSLLFCFGSN